MILNNLPISIEPWLITTTGSQKQNSCRRSACLVHTLSIYCLCVNLNILKSQLPSGSWGCHSPFSLTRGYINRMMFSHHYRLNTQIFHELLCIALSLPQLCCALGPYWWFRNITTPPVLWLCTTWAWQTLCTANRNCRKIVKKSLK